MDTVLKWFLIVLHVVLTAYCGYLTHWFWGHGNIGIKAFGSSIAAFLATVCIWQIIDIYRNWDVVKMGER